MYAKEIIRNFHCELNKVVNHVINDHVDENKETICSQINIAGNKMVESFSMEKLSTNKDLLKSYFILNSFFKEYLRVSHSIVYKYNKRKSIIVVEDFYNKFSQFYYSVAPMKVIVNGYINHTHTPKIINIENIS